MLQKSESEEDTNVSDAESEEDTKKSDAKSKKGTQVKSDMQAANARCAEILLWVGEEEFVSDVGHTCQELVVVAMKGKIKGASDLMKEVTAVTDRRKRQQQVQKRNRSVRETSTLE